MSDLIDRHDVTDSIVELWAKKPFGNPALSEICECIKRVPSAQPEIIRCKDCKCWMPYDWMFSEVWQSQNMDDYPEEEIGCQYCDMSMGANDFCSRAERRDE